MSHAFDKRKAFQAADEACLGVCLTWTADIELRAVGGEAIVSLDSAAGSLSWPLDRQDFWFGWALPEIRDNIDLSCQTFSMLLLGCDPKVSPTRCFWDS